MRKRMYRWICLLAVVLAACWNGGSFAAWAEEPGGGQEQVAAETGDIQDQVVTEPNLGQAQAAAESAAQGQPEAGAGRWIQLEGSWYRLTSEGRAYQGWLSENGRWYYMDDQGVMAQGWKEIDGKWYYFHEDGGMNLGDLILDNGVYQFEADGSLKSAGWEANTGGGAYDAGCYDEEAQALFDQMNEEKRDQYFDRRPQREDSYDGDMHSQYDRYAGFQMDMKLNEAAEHRLELAMSQGYLSDGTIPGEGVINDYLAVIRYRQSASCLELYLRDCEDAQDAFEKIMTKMERQFDAKTDRKYSLEYYRYLGMSHKEDRGEHYFLVILMR